MEQAKAAPISIVTAMSDAIRETKVINGLCWQTVDNSADIVAISDDGI